MALCSNNKSTAISAVSFKGMLVNKLQKSQEIKNLLVALIFFNTLKIEQLRKYEKLKIKIRKGELDATFLRNCQIFNVTPKFFTINLPSVSSYDLQSIKKRLLRSAVNKRNKELRSLKRDLSNHEREIGRVLSSVDKFILDNVVKKNIDKITKTTMKTHDKKLRSLTKSLSLPFATTETVHNLSSKLLREGQPQRFLRTFKNKSFFTDESYDKIYPSGFKPTSIYDLPKIHRLNINIDNLSLRPIISSIGTYNYNLSKFLTNLFAPVIPTTNCTKDSLTFCEEI